MHTVFSKEFRNTKPYKVGFSFLKRNLAKRIPTQLYNTREKASNERLLDMESVRSRVLGYQKHAHVVVHRGRGWLYHVDRRHRLKKGRR